MSVHDGDYKKAKKALGIPEDEPIFVIRGQDAFAPATIARYRNMVAASGKPPGEEWWQNLDVVGQEFAEFQANNPNRVKVPD